MVVSMSYFAELGILVVLPMSFEWIILLKSAMNVLTAKCSRVDCLLKVGWRCFKRAQNELPYLHLIGGIRTWFRSFRLTQPDSSAKAARVSDIY